MFSYRSPAFCQVVKVTQAKKLPVGYRFAMVGFAVAGLAVLLLARNLEPDPRGFGTHEQLGLTPCFFQQWTGHVCPTCGATTAWAYAVRGQLTQAVTVNLGGTLLCAATTIAVPWLLVSATVGRWIVCRLQGRVLLLVGTSWLLVVLLDWWQRW